MFNFSILRKNYRGHSNNKSSMVLEKKKVVKNVSNTNPLNVDVNKKYFTPNPIGGYRKQYIQNTNVNNKNCKTYTEVYKDTYTNVVECATGEKKTGIQGRTPKPLILSGLQPNDKGKAETMNKNEYDANNNLINKYHYSYNDLLKKKKLTYEKKLPTSFNTTSSKTNGYGGNCDCRKTVYKPSNRKFRKQSAVSSGSHLERLKLRSIQNSNRCKNNNAKCYGKYYTTNGLRKEDVYNNNKTENNRIRHRALFRARGVMSSCVDNTNYIC